MGRRSPPVACLNRGARDWHLDFVAECGLRGREVTLASSMEIVNPPPHFGAMFPDGTVVETSVGFGSLVSTHCAFSSGMLNYQKQVFKALADIMAAAQVTPSVQFGEFCWWYFNNAAGMAYYDGKPNPPRLQRGPSAACSRTHDDPLVNGSADAGSCQPAPRLRERWPTHTQLPPGGQARVLYPCDVNHPTPAACI
jgi:hypothetical protein